MKLQIGYADFKQIMDKKRNSPGVIPSEARDLMNVAKSTVENKYCKLFYF